MVLMWDRVLGPLGLPVPRKSQEFRNPREPWNPRDLQHLETPGTSRTPEFPGPRDSRNHWTPWFLRTLGKSPLPFEFQNLNIQKL